MVASARQLVFGTVLASACGVGLGLSFHAEAWGQNLSVVRPQMRPLWMGEGEDGLRRPRSNPYRDAESYVDVLPADLSPVVDMPVLPSLAGTVAPPSRHSNGAPMLFPPLAAGQPPLVVDQTWPDVLPVISTRDISRRDFMDRRRALDTDLAEAKGEAKAEVALDLTRLMLGQMLLPEARSYLRLAVRQGVSHTPELLGRAVVLERMIDVLDHKPWAGPLERPWDEELLWRLAAGAGNVRNPADVAGIEKAMAALNEHSLPVIEELLPELFDVALDFGNLPLAEALLRGASEVTSLGSKPVYLLMLGRLALQNGLSEDAFDYFARAGEGNDLAAQRARIAMADIAISRRDPKLLPVLRDILREGVNQWRHGTEGLILRARLAQVAEDLGDIPLALDIMGKIRIDHPGTPEAILAHERGALALAAFAVAVDAGEIDLETYLRSLRHVEPFYRTDPIWPIARASLARAFAREGLHVAAAAEYMALESDMERLGASALTPHQQQSLILSEAQEQLENFRFDAAAVALARQGLPSFSDLQLRYEVAALQADVANIAHAAPIGDSVETLALHAKVAREKGFVDAAVQSYQALDSKNALASAGAEALQAIITAQQVGQSEFAANLFARVSTRSGNVAMAAQPEVFEAMNTPMTSLEPLSRGLADQMLLRSDKALDVVAKVIDAAPLGSENDQATDLLPN